MKKFLIIILIIFSLILSGCMTIKREYFPENNEKGKKICILYHYTSFRNIIIKQLIDKMKENDISIITDDATNATNYKPQDYDLVVVFSGIHAFFPDVYPGLYLEKYKDQKNIIHVFFTFLTKKGVTVKTEIDNKIDTITSASVKINIDDLVNDIYELILKKLEH